MKNKGFTLIELLAVIVILTVVALVSIPLIADVIEKAKQGSAESSAVGYMNAIEKTIAINKVKHENEISAGEYTKDDLLYKDVKIKGEIKDARVLIDDSGIVVQGKFCIDGYSMNYVNSKVIKSENDYCSGLIPPITKLSYKDAEQLAVSYITSVNKNNIDTGEYSKDDLKGEGIAADDEIKDARVVLLDDSKVKYGVFCIGGFSIVYNYGIFNQSKNDYCSDDIAKIGDVVKVFEYTGEYQEFTTSYSGIYRIELWGAQGNNHGSYVGGAGSYTAGTIELNKNIKLFIYVGEQPAGRDGGWNGGGSGSAGDIRSNYIINNDGGGGATDVRIVPTSAKNIWNEFDSLKTRIMVAAGGSGAIGSSTYGYPLINGLAGGGLTSETKTYAQSKTVVVYGATQTSAGYATKNGGAFSESQPVSGGFGYGGSGYSPCSFGQNGNCMLISSGGGGGYYGGGAGGDYNAGGSGGSSFISGHDGCDAIEENSLENNISHKHNPDHYLGYTFTNTKMIDGDGYSWTTEKGEKTNMPVYNSNEIISGNEGHGHAKITLLSIG